MDHEKQTLPTGGATLIGSEMAVVTLAPSATALADPETIGFTSPGGWLTVPPGTTFSYALAAAGGGGGGSPLHGSAGGDGGHGASISGTITNHTGATQTLRVVVGQGGDGGRPSGSAAGGQSAFSPGGDGGRQSGGGGGGGGGGGASAILAGSTVLIVAGGGGGGGGEGSNAPTGHGAGEPGHDLGESTDASASNDPSGPIGPSVVAGQRDPHELGGPAGQGQNARAYFDGSGGGGGGAAPGRGGEVFVDGAEGGIGGSAHVRSLVAHGDGYFKVTAAATAEGGAGGAGATGTEDSTDGAPGSDGTASFSGGGIRPV